MAHSSSHAFQGGHDGPEPVGEARAKSRDPAYDGFNALIDAAKASGRLREGFTAEDIAVLPRANAGSSNALATPPRCRKAGSR